MLFNEDAAKEKLLKQFKIRTLKGFGVNSMHSAVTACGAILQYLEITQHTQLGHITTLSRIDGERYVRLDGFTIRSLELINSMHDEGSSLLDVLINDNAPMADRQLVKESLRTEIDSVLQTLTERERLIISAFYGIGQPEMTLEEIGNKYGLTRERVRQIKEKAIRRLRNSTKNGILKGYLG